jgi:threonine/homoserine/homoserine lactone efflux protein
LVCRRLDRLAADQRYDVLRKTPRRGAVAQDRPGPRDQLLADIDALEAVRLPPHPIDGPVVAEWTRLLGAKNKNQRDRALAATARVHGFVRLTRVLPAGDGRGMTNSFLAFLGISILVIATPGPDTALTIRNTLLGGRQGGVFTALGVAAGQAIWGLATSLGIVALVVASEPVFIAVKLAGAAYLVVLGAQAIGQALRPGTGQVAAAGSGMRRRLAPSLAFRQGVISDLGNPKMAVFFTSLLPQFAPDGGATVAPLVGLGLVFSLLTFTWLALYAAAVARAGDVLRRPHIRRAIEGVAGTVLVALGIRIAAEHR